MLHYDLSKLGNTFPFCKSSKEVLYIHKQTNKQTFILNEAQVYIFETRDQCPNLYRFKCKVIAVEHSLHLYLYLHKI